VVLVMMTLLSSCDSLSFNPKSNNIVVLITFYDGLAEVEAACGKGFAGCYSCDIDFKVCNIHSYKEKCVFYHEIDHVLHGNFHNLERAGCKRRYQGFAQ